MRLQIDQHLSRFNEENPSHRVFVIRYDDFNPFLDHFCERDYWRTVKRPEKLLQSWRLWDHMDAILCLGVTDLVDRILGTTVGSGIETVSESSIDRLDRSAARDLLLLATSYDQSTSSNVTDRWHGLRQKLRYGNMSTKWHLALLVGSAIASTLLSVWLMLSQRSESEEGAGLNPSILWLIPILTGLGSLPWVTRWVKCQLAAFGIYRHMRVGKRDRGSLRRILQQFPAKELTSQPLPRFDRTDDRYELLNKFQLILKRLGFNGIVVLMDRVDEPHLTGGKAELMQRFVWPILDNKLLKHPGIGFKIMLPQELHREVERETREFHERARLDKQNVIPAFQWTGESLYDLARARMLACAAESRNPEPQGLFAPEVSQERLLAAFQSLRVPRHLFRLLYRVLVDHCNRHTDAQPVYQIRAETFEATLALYQRETEQGLQ